MDLSRTVSDINGDFSWKSHIFPTPCICAPGEGIPWELGVGARGQKLEWWGYRVSGPIKKFDEIYLQPSGVVKFLQMLYTKIF